MAQACPGRVTQRRTEVNSSHPFSRVHPRSELSRPPSSGRRPQPPRWSADLRTERGQQPPGHLVGLRDDADAEGPPVLAYSMHGHGTVRDEIDPAAQPVALASAPSGFIRFSPSPTTARRARGSRWPGCCAPGGRTRTTPRTTSASWTWHCSNSPEAERTDVLVRGDIGAGTKAFLGHVSAWACAIRSGSRHDPGRGSPQAASAGSLDPGLRLRRGAAGGRAGRRTHRAARRAASRRGLAGGAAGDRPPGTPAPGRAAAPH